MTAIKRGIHFCYQKHFLFFIKWRDLLHAHLCGCLLWGVLFWPTLGLINCAGLSLAFMRIIAGVVVF